MGIMALGALSVFSLVIKPGCVVLNLLMQLIEEAFDSRQAGKLSRVFVNLRL